MKVYEVVTQRLLKKMEEGIIPWARGWKPKYHLPVNWVTGKPYQGMNLMLLDWNAQYATYKQINEAGGKVRKGAKSYPIIFWKTFEVEKEAKENSVTTETKYFLQYYSVFEVGIDTEGIERKELPPMPIYQSKKLVESYLKSGIIINHGYPSASYEKERDAIRMPHPEAFKDINYYQKTLFHEMIHSTGHPSRLARPLDTKSENLKSYAKEELIAEIGSSYLCYLTGIDSEAILNQNASYLQSWLRVLNDNPKMLITAASAAQKAAGYIEGCQTTQKAKVA